MISRKEATQPSELQKQVVTILGRLVLAGLFVEAVAWIFWILLPLLALALLAAVLVGHRFLGDGPI